MQSEIQESETRKITVDAEEQTADRGDSDLLRLPPESRLIIYEYALEPLASALATNLANIAASSPILGEPMIAPPLLLVCRLVRNEAYTPLAELLSTAIKDVRAARIAADAELATRWTNFNPSGHQYIWCDLKCTLIIQRLRSLERFARCLGVEVQ